MRHFLSQLRPPSIEKCSSGSVDAGFVLVLPFHHGDLEPDCVGIRGGERGAYARDKNTSARLCAKNAGGGHICGTQR